MTLRGIEKGEGETHKKWQGREYLHLVTVCFFTDQTATVYLIMRRQSVNAF